MKEIDIDHQLEQEHWLNVENCHRLLGRHQEDQEGHHQEDLEGHHHHREEEELREDHLNHQEDHQGEEEAAQAHQVLKDLEEKDKFGDQIIMALIIQD